MNTTRNGKTTGSSRKMPRRGRNNPARHEAVPVGEWEADVTAKRNGRTNAALRRKVKTVGIKQLDVADLFDEVRGYLRRGYEVRLTSKNDGEAIRLYPCLDADFTQMFVAAMTMGAFRTSLADIRFRTSHCGQSVDPADERTAKGERAERIAAARQSVTPDTVVTCPKCGTEFRVGKVLG